MTTADDLASLPLTDLVAALRAGVAGRLPDEAAIELLIEQESWLRRPDFLRRFVSYEADPDITGGPPMAWVNLAKAADALMGGGLRGGGGAADRILLIAASLGAGVPVDLRENASNSLGQAHAAMVIKAVAHAVGRADVAAPTG